MTRLGGGLWYATEEGVEASTGPWSGPRRSRVRAGWSVVDDGVEAPGAWRPVLPKDESAELGESEAVHQVVLVVHVADEERERHPLVVVRPGHARV